MQVIIDAAPGEAAEKAHELLKAIAADLAPASPSAAAALEALEQLEVEGRAGRPMRDARLEKLRRRLRKIAEEEVAALWAAAFRAVSGAADDVLEKGGLYVGPRGGKWADPAHTVPWKPPATAPAHVGQELELHAAKARPGEIVVYVRPAAPDASLREGVGNNPGPLDGHPDTKAENARKLSDAKRYENSELVAELEAGRGGHSYPHASPSPGPGLVPMRLKTSEIFRLTPETTTPFHGGLKFKLAGETYYLGDLDAMRDGVYAEAMGRLRAKSPLREALDVVDHDREWAEGEQEQAEAAYVRRYLKKKKPKLRAKLAAAKVEARKAAKAYQEYEGPDDETASPAEVERAGREHEALMNASEDADAKVEELEAQLEGAGEDHITRAHDLFDTLSEKALDKTGGIEDQRVELTYLPSLVDEAGDGKYRAVYLQGVHGVEEPALLILDADEEHGLDLPAATGLEKSLGAGLRSRLRNLARRAWLRVLGRAFGPDALAPDERAEVGDLGQPANAYERARAAGPVDSEEAGLRRSAALARAGDLARGIADRAADAAEDVFDRDDLKEIVAEAAGSGTVPKQLASDLRRASGDMLRDWDRASTTELQNAHNDSRAEAIEAQAGGDPEVYKVPAPDACSHCRRLHLGPDGHPRIFPLSVLRAHGDNAGRTKSDWKAVVGATHPHCGCELFYLAPGWGFDDDGDAVPDGAGGVRYASAEDLRKALEAEADLSKAGLVGGDVDFQGLQIRVEARAGDVRRWSGGQTVLKHAYGEVVGTRGSDGDPVDVYLGPDPTAPFAFAVDQRRPDGSFDEQKLFLGFRGPNEVEAAYKAHYPEEFWGGVLQLGMEEVKAKLAAPDPDGMLKSTGLDGRGWTDRSAGALAGGPAPRQISPQIPATGAAIEEQTRTRRAVEARRKIRAVVPVNPARGGAQLYREPKAVRAAPEGRTGEFRRNAAQLVTHARDRRAGVEGTDPGPDGTASD